MPTWRITSARRSPFFNKIPGYTAFWRYIPEFFWKKESITQCWQETPEKLPALSNRLSDNLLRSLRETAGVKGLNPGVSNIPFHAEKHVCFNRNDVRRFLCFSERIVLLFSS